MISRIAGRTPRRATLLALLLSTMWVGGCGRSTDEPAAPLMQTPAAEQAADGAVAVPACTRDCGDGVTASIQCVSGEIADCSCGDGPRARCLPSVSGP